MAKIGEGCLEGKGMTLGEGGLTLGEGPSQGVSSGVQGGMLYGQGAAEGYVTTHTRPGESVADALERIRADARDGVVDWHMDGTPHRTTQSNRGSGRRSWIGYTEPPGYDGLANA